MIAATPLGWSWWKNAIDDPVRPPGTCARNCRYKGVRLRDPWNSRLGVMGVTARPTGPSSRGKWNRLQIKWSWVHIPLRPHRGLIVKQNLLRGLCGLKVCHFFLCFSNFRQKVWIFCISTRSAKKSLFTVILAILFWGVLEEGGECPSRKKNRDDKKDLFFYSPS